MSNGKVHDELSKDLELPALVMSGIIAFHFTHNLIYSGAVAILVLVGITFQRFMTPDLDISEKREYKYGYYPFYVIYKNFGEIPYLLARYYWWPYAKLCKHRSLFSHGLIIGTLVRIAYFFIPILVVLYVLHSIFGINLGFILDYWQYSLYFILGWLLADLGHLMLDYIIPVRRFYEKILGPKYQWHEDHNG